MLSVIPPSGVVHDSSTVMLSVILPHCDVVYDSATVMLSMTHPLWCCQSPAQSCRDRPRPGQPVTHCISDRSSSPGTAWESQNRSEHDNSHSLCPALLLSPLAVPLHQAGWTTQNPKEKVRFWGSVCCVWCYYFLTITISKNSIKVCAAHACMYTLLCVHACMHAFAYVHAYASCRHANCQNCFYSEGHWMKSSHRRRAWMINKVNKKKMLRHVIKHTNARAQTYHNEFKLKMLPKEKKKKKEKKH